MCEAAGVEPLQPRVHRQHEQGGSTKGGDGPQVRPRPELVLQEGGDADSVVFDIRGLAEALVERPPPELDRYLDAASRCFARHGLMRTSVQDVARELGVNRTTVYRQVGNVDQMARLLGARDLWRMFDALAAGASVGIRTPEMIVIALEFVVSQGRSHPVLAKMLADEPHAVSIRVLGELPKVLTRLVDATAPLLASAMDSGAIARTDPRILAEWLVRLAVTLVLVPPLTDLRTFLEELLTPILTP